MPNYLPPPSPQPTCKHAASVLASMPQLCLPAFAFLLLTCFSFFTALPPMLCLACPGMPAACIYAHQFTFLPRLRRHLPIYAALCLPFLAFYHTCLLPVSPVHACMPCLLLTSSLATPFYMTNFLRLLPCFQVRLVGQDGLGSAPPCLQVWDMCIYTTCPTVFLCCRPATLLCLPAPCLSCHGT